MVCVAGSFLGQSGSPDAPAGWKIAIPDEPWRQWGFQYPVTYVFEFGAMQAEARVLWRDGASGDWTVLPAKTADDFFNGIECVRFDPKQSRAYVSVGFKGSPTIELRFTGVTAPKFISVARYYDDRRAAYSLSNDNWGYRASAHPGAPWQGPTNDASDNYQAALHVCRGFHLPVSIAINSRSAGQEAMWRTMQDELDREDYSWEPAVHALSHPRNAVDYAQAGYTAEIRSCREDILGHLRKIPYGQRVFEHILTCGYVDDQILRVDAGRFLFVRGYNGRDNPTSTGYASWNKVYDYYGVGGLSTTDYDQALARSQPKGRYNAAAVADLNKAFDEVVKAGGIFYALWHPDRYQNSVVFDPAEGLDGQRGSTLIQHLAHVANRKNIWYAANGWMYLYRYVAEHVQIAPDVIEPGSRR